LKIKRKFYVNSRDVRIVCPRLNIASHVRDAGMNAPWGEAPEDAGDSETQKVMCCAAVGQKVKWPPYLDYPGGQQSAVSE